MLPSSLAVNFEISKNRLLPIRKPVVNSNLKLLLLVKLPATEGLWFELVRGKLMVPSSGASGKYFESETSRCKLGEQTLASFFCGTVKE
jgi:hypothetical protein